MRLCQLTPYHLNTGILNFDNKRCVSYLLTLSLPYRSIWPIARKNRTTQRECRYIFKLMGIMFISYISYFVEFCLFFNYVKIIDVNRTIQFVPAFEMKDYAFEIWRYKLSQGYFHPRYQYFYFRLQRNIFYIFEKLIFHTLSVYKNYFQNMTQL